MPDEDIKLYVVYDSIASGGLVINYTSKDKITIPAQHSETGVVGHPYSVTLPKIDGYVPVIYDEEGEMTKLTTGKLNGTYLEDGELVTITYEPQTYTISFYDKAVDGTQLFEKTVNSISYKAEKTGIYYLCIEISFDVGMEIRTPWRRVVLGPDSLQVGRQSAEG